MNGQLRPLVITIVALAALMYFGGIIWAGVASFVTTPPHSPSIPDVVTNIVTGIGALLATYFGAALGISKVNKPVTSRAFLPHRWAWSKGYEAVQIAACYAYFFSLLLAAILWGIASVRGNVSANVLVNMGSAFFGVLVGVLSVVLNVSTQ